MTKYYAITSGNIQYIDDFFLVNFKYDTDRFEYIKKLNGARYLKDQKAWKIPLLSLEKLIKSDFFSPHQIDYRFDLNEILDFFNKEYEQKKLAINQIKENPFSVDSKLFKLVDLDIIVKKAEKNNLVLISGSQKMIQGLLKGFRSGVFSKKEKGFLLAVNELNSFLKLVKLFKYTFAVDSELSRLLTDGVEVRKQLPFTDKSAAELEYICLSPIFDYDKTIVIKNVPTEILAKCLPSYNTHLERNAVAKKSGLNQFLSAVENSILAGFTFAFTEKLSVISEDLNSPLLDLLKGRKSYCFISNNSECAVVFSELKELELTSKLEGCGLEISKSKSALPKFGLFTVKFRDLYDNLDLVQDILDEHKAYNFEVSFNSYLKTIEKKGQNEVFRIMQDYDLVLENKELRDKLFPHQRVGVAWLLKNSIAFLGDDMGLGKTLTVLATFEEKLKRSDVDFLIVVCPASLIRNWRKEAESWTPELKLEIIEDVKVKKLKTLEGILKSSVNGLIINYESARLDYVLEHLIQICQSRKVMICFDESQRLKNANGKTFKALQKLTFISDNRLLLSGTPTPKAITDIWSQLYMLDHGKRLGKNYYDWLGKIAELGNRYSEFAIKSFKPEAVNETLDYVQELLLRRRKEEVLDLPDKIFTTRDVELSGDQKKRYDLIREELLVMMSKSDPKQIYNLLEQYLRAVQVAVNPRLIDPDWKGEPSKFKELDQIIEELVVEQDKKIIVWTNYLKNIDELLVRYKHLGVAQFSGRVAAKDRQEIIAKFQDLNSNLKILLAVPAAGGVGITLHSAQTAVYLDKTWNAEHWLQSVDRVHRIGQTGTVNIISLNATPVDWLIHKSLDKKTKEQSKLLGDSEGLPSFSDLLQAIS